jgi:small subunit ribosomal protein S24e
MVHSELANVSKVQIKAQLAKMFKAKEESIVVFGLHTKFGGGRSSGMALIYDNLDAKKKYDCKSRLHNVS